MDLRNLALNDRLIVAADFKVGQCGGINGLEAELLLLVDKLAGTGAIIKVNSALRALGLQRVSELLHPRGVRFFADLKLVDIPETLATDGGFLSATGPEIVTVMANADVNGMRALRSAMSPKSLLLAVTILTSFDDVRCREVYGCDADVGVLHFARLALEAGVDGLILSPREVAEVRKYPELDPFLLVTPGIRPLWSLVAGDDQARVKTPRDAIAAGADILVVGRPILQASDVRVAYLRTLEEIHQGLLDA